VGQSLQGSVIELRVQLAETKISTGDMIGLRVGDIITTDKDINTPIQVSIEGVEKFTARAGAFKGRKAIQIEAPLTEPAKS
jgi:flagellar motor switch protein FliM